MTAFESLSGGLVALPRQGKQDAELRQLLLSGVIFSCPTVVYESLCAIRGDSPLTPCFPSDMTLGAVRVALMVFKVRCCIATRPMRTNRLVALCTPKIGRDNFAGVPNVNGIINADGATVENAVCHLCHAPIL